MYKCGKRKKQMFEGANSSEGSTNLYQKPYRHCMVASGIKGFCYLYISKNTTHFFL